MAHDDLLIIDGPHPMAEPPANLRGPAASSGWWILPAIALGLTFWVSLLWLISLWL